MLRRTFLKLAGLAGLTAAPKAAEAAWLPRVLVVGAGPAGMSCALDLAERGIPVTVLEADGQPGGKWKGWTEDLDGETVDVEHGVHGLWHQYVHLSDLLERSGLSGVLREPESKGAFRSPGQELSDRSWAGRRELIAELASRAKSQGYKRWRLEARKGRMQLGRLRTSIREELGATSVSEHNEGSPALTVWRVWTEMFARSMYFVGPDDLDASEWLLGNRFYDTGGPRNRQVRWLNANPATIHAGLVDRLESLGGELRLGQKVSEIVLQEGRVAGVRVGDPLPGFHIADVPEGWTRLYRGAEAPPIFLEKDGERYRAFSGRCTHARCHLVLGDEGFDCPCHGGKFDFDGQPAGGPPTTPLQPLFVDVGADGLHVEGEPPSDVIEADFVILAVDVPALKALLGKLLPQVEGLKASRETVARFWFDRDVPEEAESVALCRDVPHVDSAFLIHRLQDASAAWAATTGGSILEAHAFTDVPEGDRDEVLDAIEADVRQLYPSLEGAEALKRTLTDGRSFTHFAPGWHEHALSVETELKGLLVAGDHVRVDRNCQFMERAAYTGRVAANHILQSAGLPRAPILSER